jgi:uncharacterized repeat protein (TIGR02543 family)
MAITAGSLPATATVVCDPAGTTTPSSAAAGFGGGLGTLASPWLICSRAQLQGISTNSFTRAAHYKLSSDIDLAGSDWIPIGPVFSGIFDGQYNVISNAVIKGDPDNGSTHPSANSDSETDLYGLFAMVSGTIKKLTLTGFRVTSESTVDRTIMAGGHTVGSFQDRFPMSGALSGACIAGGIYSEIRLLDSRVSGRNLAAGTLTGGSSSCSMDLVDASDSANTVESNFQSNGGIQLGGISGFAGESNFKRVSFGGIVGNSSFSPAVNANFFGGLLGTTNYISIEQSIVSGTIRGSQDLFDYIGGFVGFMPSAPPFGKNFGIKNSVFTGTIDVPTLGSRWIGGLYGIGASDAPTLNNLILGTMPQFNSTKVGPVEGGFGAVPTDTYFNSTTLSTFGANDANEKGDGKTTAELQDVNLTTGLFSTWSIAEAGSAEVTTDWTLVTGTPVWKISTGNFPSLVWPGRWPPTAVFDSNFFGGPGQITQAIDATNGSNLRRNSFVREGYSFDGWSTESDGTGNQHQNGDIVSAPMTLYAKWTADSPETLYRFWETPLSTLSVSPKVGESVWASAFEREISRNVLRPGNRANLDYPTPEEYVYRVTKQPNDISSSVDHQPHGDYSSLSAAEQEAWYGDLGFDPSNNDPYLFTWAAFICVDDGNQALTKPTALSKSYATREDGLISDGGFETSFGNLMQEVTVSRLNPPETSTKTVVGTIGYVNGPVGSSYGAGFLGQNYSGNVSWSVLEIRSACGSGKTLQALKIVDETNNYIQTKSFAIPNQLRLWEPIAEQAVAVSAVGTTIGVTGVTAATFNAALWGLTTIAAASEIGGGGSSNSSPSPVVTTPPIVVNPPMTKSSMFTSFPGNSSRMPVALRTGIRKSLANFDNVNLVVCTGYTSGTVPSAKTRLLAKNRAKAACDLVKKVSPEAKVRLQTKPATGLGAKFRSVRLQITGN